MFPGVAEDGWEAQLNDPVGLSRRKKAEFISRIITELKPTFRSQGLNVKRLGKYLASSAFEPAYFKQSEFTDTSIFASGPLHRDFLIQYASLDDTFLDLWKEHLKEDTIGDVKDEEDIYDKGLEALRKVYYRCVEIKADSKRQVHPVYGTVAEELEN